jgi:hypothetical protein
MVWKLFGGGLAYAYKFVCARARGNYTEHRTEQNRTEQNRGSTFSIRFYRQLEVVVQVADVFQDVVVVVVVVSHHHLSYDADNGGNFYLTFHC